VRRTARPHRAAYPGTAPPSAGEPDFPSTTWPRRYTAEPPVVLVVAGVDAELFAALLDIGFARMITLSTPLPRIAGLAAHRAGGRLRIMDTHHGALFSLTLDPSRPYPRAIASSPRIGLVFTTDPTATLAPEPVPATTAGGSMRLRGVPARGFQTGACVVTAGGASLPA
jgi:hypothetical protein